MLGNTEKRQLYDQYGKAGVDPNNMGQGQGDPFVSHNLTLLSTAIIYFEVVSLKSSSSARTFACASHAASPWC